MARLAIKTISPQLFSSVEIPHRLSRNLFEEAPYVVLISKDDREIELNGGLQDAGFGFAIDWEDDLARHLISFSKTEGQTSLTNDVDLFLAEPVARAPQLARGA